MITSPEQQESSCNWYTDQQDDGNGGRVAQLGEHLLCKQGVGSSNLLTSTNLFKCLRKALISSVAPL